MNKFTLNICAMVGMILGLAAISASAQLAPRYQSHIPFDFTVGQETFTAGDYVIRVVNPESDRAILSIRSADGRTSRLVTTTPKTVKFDSNASQLVFNRYDGRYFLASMTTPDLAVGFHRSRSESKLAKQQIETGREGVALVSKR